MLDSDNYGTVSSAQLAGGGPNSVAVVPGSGHLICSVAGGVRVLDAESLDVVAQAETGIKGMYGVAASPDGSKVAAVSADGRLRVWSLEDVKALDCDQRRFSVAYQPVGVGWYPVGPLRTTSAISERGVGLGFASITKPPRSATACGNAAAGYTVAEVPQTIMQSDSVRRIEAGAEDACEGSVPRT